MSTNEVFVGPWKGKQNAGLAHRQFETVQHSAHDLTAKEIARKMGISPATVTKTLDRARFTLGMQKSVRGLSLEAMKRGIITPLIITLMLLNTGSGTEAPSTYTYRTYHS